jgi:hypothetical protein
MLLMILRIMCVKVANKQYATRAGVGKMVVETEYEGRTYVETLHNVWYMPSFSHSLLSANQLREAGHWYFSGQTPDDKNVYYMNSDNKLWLVCKRRKA